MDLLSNISEMNATLASAFLGFLGGTVINHWLANRRYDRARNDRFVDICQSLIGEMAYLSSIVYQVKEHPSLHEDDKVFTRVSLEEFDSPENTYYSMVKNDLGFLGWETNLSLRSFYVSYKSIAKIISRGRSHDVDIIDEELLALIDDLDRTYGVIERDLFREQRKYLRFRDRIVWAYGDITSWRLNRSTTKKSLAPPPS